MRLQKGFLKIPKNIWGIAWYQPSQWERLREISVDRETLEKTFEKWLEIACQNFNRLKEEGIPVERVDVDVEELLQWCKERGVAVDSEARSRFVAEKLREVAQQSEYRRLKGKEFIAT